MNVKFQFLGLPDGLEERIKFVEDEFRTNELSHTIGGYLMIIEFWNQVPLAYINIKKPSKYLQVLLDNYFDRTLNQALSQVDDENGSKAMKILRLALARVFITKPKCISILQDNETAFFECNMEEVWSTESESLPWISAEMYKDIISSNQLKTFSRILDRRIWSQFPKQEDLIVLDPGHFELFKDVLLENHDTAVEFGTVSFNIKNESFCYPIRPGDIIHEDDNVHIKKYFNKHSSKLDMILATIF